MTRQTLAVWLLGGLGILPSTSAFVSSVADNDQPLKWNLINPTALVHTNVVNRNTRAIRYFLAADAFSSANRAAELEAARACFDQWQAVPNSILRFEEGGLATGQLDINTDDKTNLIFWAKSSVIVNGGRDNISGATGMTFFDGYSDGTLSEADIVLNGVHYTWFTDFNNTVNQAQFVESVLLHEIGHLIGLAHSPAGAATLYPRGAGGVNVQAGLAPDDRAGVHALYPTTTVVPNLARLFGQVTFRGTGNAVFGAIVCAEDARGNLAAATLTRENGRYEMPAMPPGPYQVRVSPVDPGNASFYLFRGLDVSFAFASAESNFLPATNTPVNLTAGSATTLNVAVSAGTPALRINRIWPPAPNPFTYTVVNYPVVMPPGERDVVLGVYLTAVPSASATLRVTGDGLTFGPTTLKLNAFPGMNPPLNLLSVPIQVAENVTPGMRTLVVQQDNAIAYANGFLEIGPAFPDHNFDGLDDRFQRQHFPRWTAPQAGPSADPDRDGYDNTAEYISGTDPTDRASVLRVESVRVDASGATVTWRSAPGKKYQVFSQLPLNSIRGWQRVGLPVVSTGDRTQVLDPEGNLSGRFYRIQALP